MKRLIKTKNPTEKNEHDFHSYNLILILSALFNQSLRFLGLFCVDPDPMMTTMIVVVHTRNLLTLNVFQTIRFEGFIAFGTSYDANLALKTKL